MTDVLFFGGGRGGRFLFEWKTWHGVEGSCFMASIDFCIIGFLFFIFGINIIPVEICVMVHHSRNIWPLFCIHVCM